MTRAQFLNNLYRRLGGLSREQAEQHLTYYAEMLADRMEEGMTEEEAVASMEDVDTIAQRILQDEGVEIPVIPPRAPDIPRVERVQASEAEPPVPEQPGRSWDVRKIVSSVLWTVAVVAVVWTLYSRFFTGRGDASTVDTSYPYTETVVRDSPNGRVGAVVESSDTVLDTRISGDDVVEDVGDNDWGYCNYDYEGTSYDVDPADVNSIQVDWAAGLVEVRLWGEETIRFQESSTAPLTSKTELAYQVDGDTLTIRYRQEKWKNIRDAKYLTVLIPEQELWRLGLSTISADVVVTGVTVDDLEVSTNSGRVILSHVTAENLDTEATSGDMAFSDLTGGNLRVSTTSGGVVLSGVTAGELETATSSGDVVADADMTWGKFSTSSGDTDLSVSAEALELSSSSGDVCASVENEDVNSIQAKTSSGDVTLLLQEDLEFCLDFDTSSGSLSSGDFPLTLSGGSYVRGGGHCFIEVETSSGDLQLNVR